MTTEPILIRTLTEVDLASYVGISWRHDGPPRQKRRIHPGVAQDYRKVAWKLSACWIVLRLRPVSVVM